MNEKHLRELEHDKKILASAEKVWGRSGKVGDYRVRRRAEEIVNFCDLDSSKKVLEIGCGTGTLTNYLAKTEAQIIATDLFDDFLKISQEKIKASNVFFQTADAEKLKNFVDESFDAVCGLSILHHLEIQETLKSIFRVLRPGGKIAFSEPNMLNPQIALQKNVPYIKAKMGDSPDETAFFKWQIKKDLQVAGFSEIKIISFDFLHPSTPDVLAPFVVSFGNFLEKIPIVKEIAGSLFIFAKK